MGSRWWRTWSSWALGAALLGSASGARAEHAEHAEGRGCGLQDEELSPVLRAAASAQRISWRHPSLKPRAPEKLQLLGINDFHGRLSEGLRVANRPVGGAAVLAAYLRAEQASFAGTTLIVHAGDHVGATPPESALLQDEPSIEFLNLLTNRHCRSWAGFDPLCNVVGTLGNHEFDEGVAELLRLIEGGNHAKGPFLSDPYPGVNFAYVSANVIDEASGQTLLPPYAIKQVGRERLALIGAVLEATPSVVTAEGVRGVRFEDEADAINRVVQRLQRRGIEAFVVLIHQGGFQTSYSGSTLPEAGAPGGAIAEIVSRLSSAVDVVVSGHAHAFSNALLANAEGHPILITQAFSSGTAFGDIELSIDGATHDVVEKSARIVTTYADEGPGLTPAADVAALVERATTAVAPQVSRVLGEAAVALTRTQSAAGESALGNLIADAQRAAQGSELAFMNPGGIRADLDAGPITWGELFTVQPFANDLVRMDLTGAQVLALLEQQWSNPTQPRFLQVSGLTERWDGARAVGQRIVEVRVAGAALDPARSYSVTVNSFLAGGGDGFAVLTQGTNRAVGQVDLDALVTYVEAASGPISAAIEGRLSTP
jgi:5'-nucleotidase